MTQAADLMRGRRRAYAAPGGFHDRMVRWLATLLPAAIGMVAAVMILSPLSPRGEISFLLDRNKVAIAPERIRVANATYRGRDSQGRAFTVNAGGAVQVSAGDPIVQMSNLAASLTMADGPASITAPQADYDFNRDMVAVTGPVTFATSDGYRLSASGVSIDMKNRRVAGAGGISGSVPSGTFSASAISADLVERSVALVGNARLHMVPGRMRMP
jgi:lipopolysaccharide export system protein LptC